MQDNKTILRADYKPYPFALEFVNLNIEIYDNFVEVTNHMRLNRAHEGELTLFGEDLELVSILLQELRHCDTEACKVEAIQQRSHKSTSLWVASSQAPRNDKDHRELLYTFQAGRLNIPNPPDHFELTITNRIYPKNNTSLSGLYASNDLLCTQCEAEGFRRITFFPDRPDVLSVFTTRISAPKNQYPHLLSNGNLISTGELPEDRHYAVWHDPFKKPCYLFALVAGPLDVVEDEFITQSHKKIVLRLFVETGQKNKCEHAITSVKKAMRWDEEHYGREYDLDTYMIVAVPDFNMGAMENKGLNIFNAKYILVSPKTATDEDYINVEGVVAHEYFHNWTGNRITCRDWFQLSLKEGLTVYRDQEFTRDMQSRDVNRIEDVKVLITSQFPEDAGKMAHPVRPDSYQEINNFYTATVYNKGAEVIRMIQTILGETGFRQGMDYYFNHFDGQAVTIEDFVYSMEAANNIDLTQFRRWYSQAGTPVLQVQSTFENDCLTLTIEQSCDPTPDGSPKLPLVIPIRLALFAIDGSQLPVSSEVIVLKDKKESFIFKDLTHKPVISLLRDFSAPVLLEFEQTNQDKLHLLKHETNGYARWHAGRCLVFDLLLKAITDPGTNIQLTELSQAFRDTLKNDELCPALRAQILQPPSFEELAGLLKEIDVSRVEQVRDTYRQLLGQELYNDAELYYHRLWQQEDHQMNALAFRRRRLRNTCLWLMMKANEGNVISQTQAQFKHSKTMTDQLASLILLVNGKNEEISNLAIEHFYNEWQNDDLVLDKWFSVQAMSEAPHTLDRVKGLLLHPKFNIKNPNKVRALVGAFTQANPRNFHAIDGSGYAFLTEQLLVVDGINPQIAARLATPFTRLSRLDKNRQELMHTELKKLASRSLSRDLAEVVSKSLNG